MTSKVLTCRVQRPDATIKLFCLPWAGGGSSFYANWAKLLPESIEVHGVCLAGRESRFNDPVYKSLETLLDDVTSAIHASCDGKPFALWGHSLGALNVYEVACRMKKRYNVEPVHMFVSGVSAPHSEKRKKTSVDVRSYTDDEFIEILKQFGGTPADIIENRELMALFLPALRADYELLPQFSTEPPSEREVFSCPLDVFDGKDDIEHDLKAWQDVTKGPFSITMLKGGHFYLKSEQNQTSLCTSIAVALTGFTV